MVKKTRKRRGKKKRGGARCDTCGLDKEEMMISFNREIKALNWSLLGQQNENARLNQANTLLRSENARLNQANTRLRSEIDLLKGDGGDDNDSIKEDEPGEDSSTDGGARKKKRKKRKKRKKIRTHRRQNARG